MCLDIITTPKKLKIDGTGYKRLITGRGGKLKFCYNVGKNVALPIGKWIKEKDYRRKDHKYREIISASFDNKSYPMGFHVYRNKKAAEEMMWGARVVVQVKFRKACAKGIQSRNNVIVAKEIFIPKEA